MLSIEYYATELVLVTQWVLYLRDIKGNQQTQMRDILSNWLSALPYSFQDQLLQLHVV